MSLKRGKKSLKKGEKDLKKEEKGSKPTIFIMENRKAQFFLIAAVVIIVVVISVVTISNYVQKKDIVKLYDLGQELGIESQNVLDYGTYSELNEEQMKTLMEDFIKNYVSYMGEDKNIYFVFGNKQKINVAGYQDIINESVCIKTIVGGEASICTPYLTIGETKEFTSAKGDIDRVVIRIAEVEYEFALSYGENFYFVIWQSVGGEKHVVTSRG